MDHYLRKAFPEDAARINELFSEMLSSVSGDNSGGCYESGYLDKFFSGGADWICVAEINGSIVGYISIEVHGEDDAFIYLDDFSVGEKFRNMGIGTRLMEESERYARDINIPQIVLNVEKSNEAARRLYERLGFYEADDDGARLRMKKEL